MGGPGQRAKVHVKNRDCLLQRNASQLKNTSQLKGRMGGAGLVLRVQLHLGHEAFFSPPLT